MPGPVDPARLLVAELGDGAFAGVTGMIQPDWERDIRTTGPLARPGRASAPTSSSRPSSPANIGSTPMPRTTLASRSLRPIQSSPL